MPKIELDSRIMLLVIPLLFIIAAIAVGNFIVKAVFHVSLSQMPVGIQFLVHFFALLLVVKVVRMLVH